MLCRAVPCCVVLRFAKHAYFASLYCTVLNCITEERRELSQLKEQRAHALWSSEFGSKYAGSAGSGWSSSGSDGTKGDAPGALGGARLRARQRKQQQQQGQLEQSSAAAAALGGGAPEGVTLLPTSHDGTEQQQREQLEQQQKQEEQLQQQARVQLQLEERGQPRDQTRNKGQQTSDQWQQTQEQEQGQKQDHRQQEQDERRQQEQRDEEQQVRHGLELLEQDLREGGQQQQQDDCTGAGGRPRGDPHDSDQRQSERQHQVKPLPGSPLLW